MDLILDVNTQIYPMALGNNYKKNNIVFNWKESKWLLFLIN